MKEFFEFIGLVLLLLNLLVFAVESVRQNLGRKEQGFPESRKRRVKQ